jgi:hypothetical protein
MAEPIKHLDGKHYEDIFKLADTDEDGRVTIEELEHKDKWTASYPPGGHPGMSKETFLKRRDACFGILTACRTAAQDLVCHRLL